MGADRVLLSIQECLQYLGSSPVYGQIVVDHLFPWLIGFELPDQGDVEWYFPSLSNVP